MKVGIVFNPTIPGAQHESSLLENYLRKRGIEVTFNCTLNELSDALCDVLIVMGGDGSMLQVAGWLAESGVPALGIKQGRLGFLMSYSVDDYDMAVDALIEGRLKEVKTTMLEISLPDGEKRYVLNDFVLERFSNHRTVEIEVETKEGKLVFLGDGVVVSTPVGSTAYNLAAGGSVICPDLKAIQVTPLNPHGVIRTSFLIPPESTVILKMLRGTGRAVFDGIHALNAEEGFSVEVSFSDKTVTLLKDENHRFLEVLKAKFGFGKGRMG